MSPLGKGKGSQPTLRERFSKCSQSCWGENTKETENSIHILSLMLHISHPVIIIINNKHSDVRPALMVDFYMNFVQKKEVARLLHNITQFWSRRTEFQQASQACPPN